MRRILPFITIFAALLIGILAMAAQPGRSHATFDAAIGATDAHDNEQYSASSAKGSVSPSSSSLAPNSAAAADLQVYVFSSGNTNTDQRVLEVLSSGGFSPTLGLQPGQFTGSEVDLTQYNAVVLQNSHNWSISRLSNAGQSSLVEYVQNGGGLITGEWFVYNFGNSTTAPIYAILPATWPNWTTASSTTYTVDTPDATINAGLPNNFTFQLNNIGGSETTLQPKQGAISFYRTSAAGGSGLVGWQAGTGRVASFSNLMTSVELQSADLARLLNNTVSWVAGKSSLPNRIFLSKRVGLNGACNRYRLYVASGTEVTYCYEVTNRSALTLTKHTLTDDKLGTLINSAAITLTPGEKSRFTTTAVINADTLNVATWTAEDAAGTVISDTAQAFVSIAKTDLRVYKSLYAPSVVGGDELTYYIYYRNQSTVAAQNVVISDVLPTELTFVSSGVQWTVGTQTVVTQTNGNLATWSISELPAWSYGYLFLKARVADSVAVNDAIANPVTIRSSTADSNPANNVYTHTVKVQESIRDLSIEKRVYGTAQAGKTLNYYIYYRNLGNRTIDNIRITDTLPSGVSYRYHYDYYRGATMQQVGNDLVWSLNSLRPYQTGYLYLSAVITDNIPADTVLTNTITIAGDGPEVDTSNNTSVVTSTVIVPGRITGTVTMDDGTPIQWATVQAYRSQQGRRYWANWARTDANGNYTLDGLPAGDYYVYFYSRLGSEIYNDVTNIVSATLVSVTSGQTTPNINAQFAPPAPPKATVDAGNNYVYTDPRTGESRIWINRSNPSDLTISKTITCTGNVTPTNVTLVFETTSNGTFEYAMTGSGSTYTVTVPAGDLTRGTFSVDYDCGSESVHEVIGHGLIDPSGFITDADTGDPIVGATVELFTIDGWVPKTGPDDTRPNTCHTVDSRPSVWNDMPPAPLIGRLGDPLADPQEIDPTQNPLLTDNTGYYAWDVAAGCWYIVVTKEGYETRVSPVVGVPPEVTDLHLTMKKIGSAEVSFGKAEYTASENGGAVLIDLTLSDITQSDVTVTVASSDGTAQAGSDYTAVNQAVTIPAGQPSASVSLNILDDGTTESNETLTLTLSNPVNAKLGATSTATVTIVDDDKTTSTKNMLYLPITAK